LGLKKKQCTPESTLCLNRNAPSVALYAFLGPLLGSIVRPFGGWLSDKFGGAVVTQFTIGVMTGASIGKKTPMLKSQSPTL